MGAKLRVNVSSTMDYKTIEAETTSDYKDIKAETTSDYKLISFRESPPSPAGTRDYEKLINKPSIEGVTLIRNKTFEDLGLIEASKLDIERILQS